MVEAELEEVGIEMEEVEVEEDELNAREKERETLKRQSFRAEKSVGCGRCARKKSNGEA